MLTSKRACEDLIAAQLYSDLAASKKPGADGLAYQPSLWFREYRQWEPHSELRCFMREKTFVGASQYHGITASATHGVIEAEPFPELVGHGHEYEALIKEWFPTFAAAAPYRSCVFDVIVDRPAHSVTLLETNPAATTTFPGLKDWRRPETFNGELDWIDAPYRNPTINISADELAQLRRDRA